MADPNLSDRVKSQMNRLDIHDRWESTYRRAGNEQFYELCYDHIVQTVNQPEGSRALDIGCGVGANTVRLARRGYHVEASDYSEPILEKTRENIRQLDLEDQVDISRQDITNLSFPNDSFDLTLCWGVLMHIPQVEEALAQLARVTRPNGYLVFEEVNYRSPEARLNRAYWNLISLFRDKKIVGTKVPAGIEHVVDFNDEKLFWRQVSLPWLVEELAKHGCRNLETQGVMFTELHLLLPEVLQSPFNAWNRFYQSHLHWTPVAKHSLLIFQKS